MNILILGNASDAHAHHLNNALTEAGATVHYLDTHLFPRQIQLSWDPCSQKGSLILPTGFQLDFQAIKSVFWRSFHSVGIPKLEDVHQQRIVFNDAMSALRVMMKACPARWINSWQAYQFHKEKPLQLQTIYQLGVAIPDTLITNNPQEVIQFVNSHPKVIFKPIYGGSHTQIVTDALLEIKRLSLALKIAPITLQTYIPGTNVRSYVIDDCVYSAEIRSGALDFREDANAQLIPIELPSMIKQQCLSIAEALFLKWTAIDWRLTPSGDYVFLEANPSPMFLHFENNTGFPITQRLVELLMN
ncbi:MAG: hypothetical protein QNJ42_24330 [Crocosphaera sp.]|nr:hypothetical protein [Crocosphaera sp.]